MNIIELCPPVAWRWPGSHVGRFEAIIYVNTEPVQICINNQLLVKFVLVGHFFMAYNHKIQHNMFAYV